MSPVSKKQIDRFLEPRKLAIAGVSRNPKKFGHMVFSDLKKSGYDIYPVNPDAAEIEGTKCYTAVSELPGDVKHLLIITPKNQTDSVLKDAINHGMTSIWVQQMSETETTIKIAEEYKTEVILKKCIYMFAEPVAGIHKFHRGVVKFFGRLPR